MTVRNLGTPGGVDTTCQLLSWGLPRCSGERLCAGCLGGAGRCRHARKMHRNASKQTKTKKLELQETGAAQDTGEENKRQDDGEGRPKDVHWAPG